MELCYDLSRHAKGLCTDMCVGMCTGVLISSGMCKHATCYMLHEMCKDMAGTDMISCRPPTRSTVIMSCDTNEAVATDNLDNGDHLIVK